MTEYIVNQSEPGKQDKNQISEKNLSDFGIKFSKASDFEIRNYDSSYFEEKYIFEKHDFQEKNIFKKRDFGEQISFKKQILTKILHTKIQVLIQFTRNTREFCVWRAVLKSTIWGEIFFLKSMILNAKFFLKSVIVIWKLHYMSEFELQKIQRVRFWILKNPILSYKFYNVSYFKVNFLNTRQISSWIFYKVSVF